MTEELKACDKNCYVESWCYTHHREYEHVAPTRPDAVLSDSELMEIILDRNGRNKKAAKEIVEAIKDAQGKATEGKEAFAEGKCQCGNSFGIGITKDNMEASIYNKPKGGTWEKVCSYSIADAPDMPLSGFQGNVPSKYCTCAEPDLEVDVTMTTMYCEKCKKDIKKSQPATEETPKHLRPKAKDSQELKDFKWLKSIRLLVRNGYMCDEDCWRIQEHFKPAEDLVKYAKDMKDNVQEAQSYATEMAKKSDKAKDDVRELVEALKEFRDYLGDPCKTHTGDNCTHCRMIKKINNVLSKQKPQ